MAKANDYKIEDYLEGLEDNLVNNVTQIHNALLGAGFSVSLALAKSGFVVSYTDPRTKRVAANLITRKKGPIIRIYADNVSEYEPALAKLPPAMVKHLAGAAGCRRLLDPSACSPTCPMGYIFDLEGNLQKKCRYNCFLFVMDDQQTPYILELLAEELARRTA